MTYPYFFISSDRIIEDAIVINGNDFNHLINVLRVRVGDSVKISDNNRYKYMAQLISIGKTGARLRINKKTRITRQGTGIVLFQCILKREAMELAIQKTTEIGIECIIPVFSARVIPDKEKARNKVLRWQMIAEQASKQCKRDFICEILPPMDIGEIDISVYKNFFVPCEIPGAESRENFTSLGKYIIAGNADKAAKKDRDRIAYLIGPEGGFEEKEIDILSGKGSIQVNFGRNILKAETAAIYFLSVLDYLIKRNE